jgi:hypothetical protein
VLVGMLPDFLEAALQFDNRFFKIEWVLVHG